MFLTKASCSSLSTLPRPSWEQGLRNYTLVNAQSEQETEGGTGRCKGLHAFPQNSYAETLIPYVMAFGVGVFGR